MRTAITRSAARKFCTAGCLILALLLGACGSRQERAENYYESAMKYLAEKDYVKANIELRNALQLNNDMVEAWRALTKIYEHNKNVSGLVGALRRVVELDPKDFDSLMQLGRLYLFGNALPEALKATNSAVDLKPDDPETHALKAAILFRLQDNEGAAGEAEQALKLDPGNANATAVLAAREFSKNNFDNALKLLDGVKPTQKDELGIVLLRLNVYSRMKRFDEVESLLQTLIKQHPDQPAFRGQLVKFYISQKRTDDAEKELRAFVQENPDEVAAELQLVSLLAGTKGADAARAELETRIKAGGNVFPLQMAMAKIDAAQGKTTDAITLLKGLTESAKKPEDVIAAKVLLADIYISKNDINAAEPLIGEVLEADKRNIEGLRLRAVTRISRGKYDDAVEDLRRALNDQPRSPQLLQTLGAAYEHTGAIELAGKAYLDAAKAANYAPTYGLNYVQFLQRRGLGSQAESVLSEIVSRNPNNVAALSALAQAKLARQDWVGAHAIAEQIKKIGNKRDDLIAEQIQGAAFIGEKKYSESLASLEAIHEAAPQAAQPMAAIVMTYMEAKQPEKAEAFLQSALKANPNNADALVLYGGFRLSQNKPEEALKYFNAAIEKQPKNAAGYRALINFYMRERKLDDALKVARDGIKQQPHNFALGLSLAGILEAKRDYDGAIAQYEAMLKDEPGSMIIVNNLASLLADHRTDKESLERAKTLAATLNKSEVPQFKDTMGWIAYRTGDYSEAVKLLEDASAKLASLPLVKYHLGMAYLASNEREKALEQFKKVQQLAPNDNDLKTKIDAALNAPAMKNGEKAKSDALNPG